MNCEFTNVCQVLKIDQRLLPFPSMSLGSQKFAISDTFGLLQNPATQEYVRSYDMPVYYSNKTYPANIIFYGGRRWILTTEWDFFQNSTPGASQNSSTKFFLEKTVAAIESGFHGYHQAQYTPLFISDPVDFETPDFQATPIGLGWWTGSLESQNQLGY